MKIARIIPLLLAILLFGTLAHGKRKKPVKDNRPVVAVMNLKVDSNNPQVQAKINELTAKIRDEIADSVDTCQVLRTKQMKTLWRKNRQAIEACYDDCDTEMAILFGAQFVIVGFLEPSQTEIIATLEIIDTRTRNPIATRKVKGGNYFEIESSILSTIKKFVRPLNNIVMQATDDEVIADSSSEPEDEYVEEKDEDEGTTESQPQERRQESDAEYVPPSDDGTPDLSPREERWEEAQQEPNLPDAEGWAFMGTSLP